MAVSDTVTSGDDEPQTKKVARQHPEAVKAVAERSRRNGRDELADYLFRALSNVDN